MKIDIWSDIACPWCFIGKRRFEKALATFAHRDDVEIHWHSYQLDPALPERYDGSEVDYLVASKGMPRENVEQMISMVGAQAAEEGLHYDFDHLVVANSLPGHHLLHLAARRGVADQVKEALLSAHFEKGQDIGDDHVLIAIGEAHGLSASDVREALTDPELTAEIGQDFAQARAYGISGVPFFVLDEKYGVSGAQPPEVFSRALEQAWRDAHPLVVAEPVGPICGPEGC
ncbi:DsbA family oxidoreductase [Branchiibius cervicis]|uniref:DsbA family oxidoreductase n=1 Tax=Branchiibius cervicis TaxID=908252 RepID=A0ABW2APW6_9MICO